MDLSQQTLVEIGPYGQRIHLGIAGRSTFPFGFLILVVVVALFPILQCTCASEAISREVSVFTATSAVDAISREVSVFTATSAVDAISREVSVFTTTNLLADLSVAILDGPEIVHAGGNIDIVYAVTNRGIVRADGLWRNQILLSQDIKGLFANPIATSKPMIGLSPGSSITLTQTVIIPATASGTLFIEVYADAFGDVPESLEVNNSAFRPLTVHPSLRGPAFAQQPLDLTTNAYSKAQLAGIVSGSPTPSLQWRWNGVLLIGQTNATLVFTNLQPWEAGAYDLVASNPIGSVTSSVARVVVLPAANPICVSPPSGLVGWWPGDGNANDLTGANNGILENGVGFATGKVQTSFRFNGDGANNFIRVPYNPSSPLFNIDTQFTYELWLNPFGGGPLISREQCVNAWPSAELFLLNAGGANLSIQLLLNSSDGANYSRFESSAIVTTGQWHHVVATYNQAIGSADLYLDGVAVFSGRYDGTIWKPSTPMLIGGIPKPDSLGWCWADFFSGLIDEVAVYKRALTAQEISLHYAAGSAGMCKPTMGPSFVKQPESLSVYVTTPVAFIPLVAGDEPLRYQWRFNGSPLSDQTNRSLSFPSAQPSLAGGYDLIVSNPLGSVTSVVATLTVRTDVPDLAAGGVTAPRAAGAGQIINVPFTLSNNGSGTASSPWGNQIFLATNTAGQGVRPLFVVPQSDSLPVGASITVTQSVIVPSDMSGNWFLGVTANVGDDVFETNRANNTFIASTPTFISSPDLQASFISSGSKGVFGQSANITWSVRNTGNGPTFAPWSDAIFFSTNPNSLDGATRLGSAAASSSLGLGASYTNTLRVTLPVDRSLAPGTYYLIVRADTDNTQPEANEGNNLVSRGIQLDLPPRPDLLITTVQTSTYAAPGQTIAVSWTVTNQGPAIATAQWIETLYGVPASAGPSNIVDNAGHLKTGLLTLGTFTYSNSLPPSASLTRTQFVSLPINGPAGDLRMVVVVDGRDDVFEENETNNVALSDGVLHVPVALTLQLSSSQISEDATVPVRATLSRNGSTTDSLNIILTHSDPTELTYVLGVAMPAITNIVIPAGQSAVVFSLYPIRDFIVDLNKDVTLTAQATGYDSASAQLTVLNADLPTLSLASATNVVSEGSPVTLTVTRDVVTSSPLTVTLSSSNPGQLSPPNFVIIPGGAVSVSFAVLAVDDNNAEASNTYSISAAAPGFNSGVASVTVQDNDVPHLTVTLSASSVSEGAGPQALSMTVTRDPVGAGALNIEPEVANSALVNTPIRITIPPGQASRSFPIGVVDDALVNGTRQVALTAYPLATGTGARLPATTAPVVLNITDDDGPTLKIEAARKLVPEGANPATLITLTRNTPATSNLVVTLTTSRTNEARFGVPAAAGPSPNGGNITVTIPIDQTSATFPLVTINDHTNDGNQAVTLTAEAPGFTTGVETVIVSDTDLPDLVVSSVSAPAAAVPQQKVSVSYRVTNQGLSVAKDSFLTRVFLSKDAVVGGDDVLVAQFRNTSTVAVGSSIEDTEQIQLPLAVGQYWIMVESDAEQTLAETLEDNNVRLSAAPISVSADYGAWVKTDITNAPANTPVSLYGRATNSFGAGAAARGVNVHVRVRGTERVLSAMTDSDGNFNLVFTPLSGEAGRYEIFATHPGVSTGAVQDSFDLLGFRANPANVSLTIIEGTTQTGRLSLENLSEVALSRLAVQVVSKPANLTVATDLASTGIPGSGASQLNYSFTATTADSYGAVMLRVKTAEGVSQDVSFAVSVERLTPRLVATPNSLYAAMPLGGQAVVDFDVANLGGKSSGPITVSLPAVPWMRLASTNPIPNLDPGQTNHVTLLLTPSRDLPLGPYTGSLALNSDSSGATVPFTFRAMSECVGDLRVDAVDEFTYYAEGAPHLAGASVTIRDAVTRTNVATGVTDTNGLCFFARLPENYYEIEVTADKHTTYRATRLLQAGITNDIQSFLSRLTVTYTWTVDPAPIDDRYTFVVDTIFESAVPLPVITIEPKFLDFQNLTSGTRTVLFRITNHGLVAAQGGKLKFPTHPLYRVTPLIEDVGIVPASSSVVVPVVVAPTAYGEPDRSRVSLRLGTEQPVAETGAPNFPSLAGYLPSSNPIPCDKDSTIRINVTAQVQGQSQIIGDINASLRWIESVDPDTGIRNSRYNQEGVFRFREPWGELNRRLEFRWVQVRESEQDCVIPNFLHQVLRQPAIDPPFDGLFNQHPPNEPNTRGADREPFYENTGPSQYAFPNYGDPYLGKQFVETWTEDAPTTCLNPASSKRFETFLVVYDRSRGVREFTPLAGYSWEVGSGPGDCQTSSGLKSITAIETDRIQVAMNHAGFGNWHALKPNIGTFAGALADLPCEFGGEFTWTLVCGGRDIIHGTTIPAINTFVCEELQAIREPVVRLISQITKTIPSIPRSDTPILYDPPDISVAQPLCSVGVEPLPPPPRLQPAELMPHINAGLRTVLPPPVSNEICARVRIRLEQEAVLARDAFRATLELDNNGATRLENVQILVKIQDESGRVVTNLFAEKFEGASVLSAVDGSGVLPANSSGIAKWLFVPTVDAAPQSPTRFLVGGTLSYRLDGTDVSVDMAPVPITVLPSPRLSLQYFHQRDVFSDDPFTTVIEPAVPYSLAVMVQNRGYGKANNFRITSAQPKIIENEKGLLIDFNIIATDVFKPGSHYGLTPSLTANFGDINPGETAIGRWLLTSSLHGLFIDYSANFEHIDGLGNPRLSLIDDVNIHEMIHLVQAGGIWEDNKPDFFVNEIPDINDSPDTLYQSNGSTNSVAIIEQADISGTLSPESLNVTLKAPMPGDWAYLRVPDPGTNQYRLVSCKRSDGVMIPVGTNVWTTDRTFIGMSRRPRIENTLHLLDYNSSGQYTLTYEPGSGIVFTDTNAPVSSVSNLPPTVRPYFQVRWFGKDEAALGQPVSGIAYYDVYVSSNGGPFTPWLTKTELVSATYIGELGSCYAFYSVATDANGNREPVPGTPEATTCVGVSNSPPSIAIVSRSNINEGTSLDLSFIVSDRDADQALTVTLNGAPPGVVLDAAARRLTWPTGEGNGPSTNVITLVVRDNDFQSLSATGRVTVVVNEVNQAPTLNPIANYKVNEGQALRFVASASDPDLPAQKLWFSLGAGAPAGAKIEAASGQFEWIPNAIQGGHTNRIAVVVSDNAVPSLSATQTFQVVVRDTEADFRIGLTSTNLMVGETGVISVPFSSGVALRQLNLTLPYDTSRLGDFAWVNGSPEVKSATVQNIESNRLAIVLVAADGDGFVGSVRLGDLRFVAPTDANSGLIVMEFSSGVGLTMDGQVLRNPRKDVGKVVLVNREPVLDALLSSNGVRSLSFYGLPGRRYQVLRTSGMNGSAPWEAVETLTLDGRYATIRGPGVELTPSYFRAIELSDVRLLLSPAQTQGKWVLTLERTDAKKIYVVETSANLVDWVSVSQHPGNGGALSITNSTPTNIPYRFYRTQEK